MDSGDGRYDCCTGAALEDYLERIAQNGGNSFVRTCRASPPSLFKQYI